MKTTVKKAPKKPRVRKTQVVTPVIFEAVEMNVAGTIGGMPTKIVKTFSPLSLFPGDSLTLTFTYDGIAAVSKS
jgi:hypothetical protein